MSLKRLAKKDDLLDDSPGTQVLAADRSGEPRLETGKADADAGDGGEWRGPCKGVCRDGAKRAAAIVGASRKRDYSRFLVRVRRAWESERK